MHVLDLRSRGAKSTPRTFSRARASLNASRAALTLLAVVLLMGAPGAFAVTSSHVLTPHFGKPFPARRTVTPRTGKTDVRLAALNAKGVLQTPALKTVKPMVPDVLKNSASQSNGMSSHAAVTGATSALVQGPSRNFGGFLAAPSYQTVPYPNTDGNLTVITMTADVNKDGSPDLVTLDEDGGMNVLLNDGKGHFKAPISNTFPTLSHFFTGAQMVDVDGDGYLDVVAKEYFSQNIDIFHNNHDGTFALTASSVTPTKSDRVDVGSFLVADVNGDGILDLISLASNYTEDDSVTPPNAYSTITVETFLGTGKGSFNTANPVTTVFTIGKYNVGLPNNGVLLATLNGKTNLFIEAQDYDELTTGGMDGTSVIALPSNGDGSFATASPTEVDFAASYPYVTDNTNGMAIVDLNGDGYPDISLNFGDDYLYTALGQPGGTFGAPQVATPGVSINAAGWALVDVTGDGLPDFVDHDCGGINVEGYTAIWPGKGDGTFGDPVTFYATGTSTTGAGGNSPGWNMAVADFDGDGNLDLAIVDGDYQISYNRASIFIGRGDGSFHAAPAVAPTNDPNTFPYALWAQVSLDMNGDGKTDLLTLDTMGDAPYPYLAALSDGKGGFTYKQALAGGAGGYTPVSGVLPVAGDFNGDGLQDLVFSVETGNYFSGNLQTFFAVALSNGDGTFQTPVALNMGTTPFTYPFSAMTVGDVNGDGKLDIVAPYSGDTSGYVVLLGNGDGTFQPAVFTPYGAYPDNVALMDFNGDGNLDLVIGDSGDGQSIPTQVTVLPGDGTGAFNATNAVTVETEGYASQILVGDLNGDKRPDLVVLSQGSYTYSGYVPETAGAWVYLNNGNGGFSQGAVYEAGREAGGALLADFNNDGFPDLYFSELPETDSTLDYYGSQVMLGNGDGTFGAPVSIQIPPASTNLAAGDFLQDGSMDLVATGTYGPIILLLNQGGTTISLATASPTVSAGANEVITATVQATMQHQAAPTGTMVFSENGTVVGSADVVAGTATLSVALPSGAHTLTAAYTGDANYNPNANAGTVQFTVAVAAPPVAPSFVLTSTAGSLNLSAGQSAAVTLTVSGNSTYSGTVNFAVSGMIDGLSVSVTPAMVTLTPGQTASATVLVNTVSQSAQKTGAPAWMNAAGGLSLACALGLILPVRRKKLPRVLMTIAVAASSLWLVVGLSGCSSSNNLTSAPSGRANLVITATPSVTGAPTQAANIVVSVE